MGKKVCCIWCGRMKWVYGDPYCCYKAKEVEDAGDVLLKQKLESYGMKIDSDELLKLWGKYLHGCLGVKKFLEKLAKGTESYYGV